MGVHVLGDQRRDSLPHLIGNREDPRHRPVLAAPHNSLITANLDLVLRHMNVHTAPLRRASENPCLQGLYDRLFGRLGAFASATRTTEAALNEGEPMTVERTSAPTAPSQPLEQQVRDHPERFRVLTGDRPTGPLHLGHYFGTLANRVRLQRAGIEVFLVIADYQVITDRDGVGDLSASVREVVLDYLAAGIDPARATIFTHSAVPALNQLVVPFLSLVTVAELGRNPTVKAEADATRARRGMSGLLFTYPVHQAADILFCHGNLVPVGRDQLPHLELTRLIARRFNERYAAGTTVFASPMHYSAPLLFCSAPTARR